MGSRSFFVRFGIVLTLWALTPGVEGASVTTTIYVGRHFEIRDHDQPTKYVFDGETRVAEVIGSLSNNVRVQRLRLYPGWNLCSLAVSGLFPASGADMLSAAYQWNIEAANYSEITLGQVLVAGTVLWLMARTNAMVDIVGVYPEPIPRQIPAGGAYVSAAGLEAWSPVMDGPSSSWEFNTETAQWSAQFMGDLAGFTSAQPTVSPGQAFYFQTLGPASLEVPDPTLRIRYYHEDHLNSSSVITDNAGQIVEELAFYSFGVVRNRVQARVVQEPYQFTQKEQDRESGLEYFGARYYGAGIARWMSHDTAAKDGANPYVYAKNNPIRFVDPEGFDDWEPGELRDLAATFGCNPGPGFHLENIRNEPEVDAFKMLCNAAEQNREPAVQEVATYSTAATIAAGIGDALSFIVDTHEMRKQYGITDVNEHSKAYVGSRVVTGCASDLNSLSGTSGRSAARAPTAAAGGGIENTAAFAKTPKVHAGPSAFAKTEPVGSGVTADTPGISGARAQAAAVAASNARVSDYMQIFEAAKGQLRPMSNYGWTDGQILNEAFNIANRVWTTTFGTKPPGL